MAVKLTTLIPIVFSGLAVALTIALLCFGRTPSSGTTNYWMTLNASQVGQSLIQLSPASSSAADDAIGTLGGGSGLGGFLDGIINSIIGNLTQAVDEGIEDLQGIILHNLTMALGIRDVYNLYVSRICQGDFDDASDPHSKVTITECVDYADHQQGLRNLTESIPDHFVLGTTNITIPLVSALGALLSDTFSLATTGSHALLVLLILGAVTSGLTFLGSILSLFLLPPATAIALRQYHHLLAILNTCASALATVVLMVLAAVATGIIVGGQRSIHGLSTALGLAVGEGSAFLALTWVAAAGGAVAATYWLAVWFVEFRRTAFARRRRSPEEIGNWKGIWREVREDLRVDRLRKVQ